MFSKARQVAPCVLLIDEIDTLAPARGSYQGETGVSDHVVGKLLTEIDGILEIGQVLVVAATNRYQALDSALLRSGRFDLQLKIDLSDYQSRLAILKIHNQQRPLKGVNLQQWAQPTEGWNGADLELLSNQAALSAVRKATSQGISDPNQVTITPQDFQAAYERLIQQRSQS